MIYSTGGYVRNNNAKRFFWKTNENFKHMSTWKLSLISLILI